MKPRRNSSARRLSSSGLARRSPKGVGGPDRRRGQRYLSSFDVQIRFLPDGTPLKASGNDIGPNGMRVVTSLALMEASYIHISFESASNNTHCEGRVVWTKRKDRGYESGIDIQRWGGDMPGTEVIHEVPNLIPQKDRRKKPRCVP